MPLIMELSGPNLRGLGRKGEAQAIINDLVDSLSGTELTCLGCQRGLGAGPTVADLGPPSFLSSVFSHPLLFAAGVVLGAYAAGARFTRKG